MLKSASRSALPSLAVPTFVAAMIAFGGPAQSAPAQVFVVGEHSATAGIATDFTPTRLPLPSGHLSERGRRELIRDLEAEQGFAHRVLPMGGAGLTLQANGGLTPGPELYKEMIYKKGQSAAAGERVVVTNLLIKPDRIVIDLNGGPFAKHRFLSHISLNDAPMAQPTEQATGSRVSLVFEGGVPEISAPEVKALLAPIIDFGAKTASDAYADTLPAPIKESIAAHEVLVGMDRRMVIAAAGAPESKVREHATDDADGPRYEEWIYGHVPQTVKFVRFNGDHVVQVKIAALGKPIEIHSENEMGEYGPQAERREIALGDGAPDHHGAPTLREPGEAVPVSNNSAGRVQYPPPSKPVASTPPLTTGPTAADAPAAGPPSPAPANHLAGS